MLGGTGYADGFSSGDLGGAIAEAVLHDIRVNCLGLAGFPQIFVKRIDQQTFNIRISFADQEQTFSITAAEAKAAVKAMKDKRGHSVAIFDRVQEALANLEGAVMNRRK